MIIVQHLSNETFNNVPNQVETAEEATHKHIYNIKLALGVPQQLHKYSCGTLYIFTYEQDKYMFSTCADAIEFFNKKAWGMSNWNISRDGVFITLREFNFYTDLEMTTDRIDQLEAELETANVNLQQYESDKVMLKVQELMLQSNSLDTINLDGIITTEEEHIGQFLCGGGYRFAVKFMSGDRSVVDKFLQNVSFNSDRSNPYILRACHLHIQNR